VTNQLTNYEKRQANKLTDSLIIATFTLLLFGISLSYWLRGFNVETVQTSADTAFTINMTWHAEFAIGLMFVSAILLAMMQRLWRVQYA